jgi:hypothetical protein
MHEIIGTFNVDHSPYHLGQLTNFDEELPYQISLSLSLSLSLKWTIAHPIGCLLCGRYQANRVGWLGLVPNFGACLIFGG